MTTNNNWTESSLQVPDDTLKVEAQQHAPMVASGTSETVDGDGDDANQSDPNSENAAQQELEDAAASEEDEDSDALAVERSVYESAIELVAIDPSLNAIPQAAVAGSEPPAVVEATVDLEPDPLDDAQNAALAQVQSHAAAASQEVRNYNLNRYMMVFTAVGSIAAAAGLIYSAIHDKEAGKDNTATPALNSQVQTLVQLWGTGNDTAYWTHLANYVDQDSSTTSPLSLGDQVQFMSYTIDIWPDINGWMWNSATDKAKVVLDLIAEYDKNKKVSDIYRLVTTYTATNANTGVKAIMPRAIAAARLQIALSSIIYPTIPS